MKTDWTVQITKCVNRLGFEMSIYRINPLDKVFVLEDFEREVEIPTGHVWKPTFIPAQVMEALVEAINPQHKQQEGKFIEGKLAGTEKHLEDLRKLLKLR